MRVATLYYSPSLDDTKISFNDDFKQLETLMRLDALKDCIGLLEQEYENTYKLWSRHYANK